MIRVRTLGLALVAVLAASAVAAVAAQATEGPFYKVGGVRLSGNKEIEVKAVGNQILRAAGVTVTCSAVKVPVGSVIIGLNVKQGDQSKETLEYSGCTVAGNGSPCEVESKEVKTKKLENLLGYETSTRTGKVLTGFKPEGATAKEFATIKFTGTGCTVTSTKVELGSGDKLGVACETLNEAGLVVSVNANETEGTKGFVRCPKTPIGKLFYEKAGAIEELKAGLVAFFFTSEYEGQTEVKIKGGTEKFGVFTK